MKKNLTREVVMYLLFGTLTTFINIISYSLLYYSSFFERIKSQKTLSILCTKLRENKPCRSNLAKGFVRCRNRSYESLKKL